MPLKFLDRDPEPQPVRADARALQLIQAKLKYTTPAWVDSVLPIVVIGAMCKGSEGMVTFDDACDAYMAHPDELGSLIRESFEQKSFEKLRRTVVLRKVYPNVTQSKEAAELERQALRFSWNVEYQGEAASHLELAIREMIRDRTPSQLYANTMPIVQSSGTGKSRMVDQLAQRVFTLPFNLRDPADTKQGAYPDPDSRVFDMFVTNPIGGTKVVAAARFGAFLIALFDRVPEEMYATNREKLYMEAVENHGAIFTDIQNEVSEVMNAEPYGTNAPENQAILKQVVKKYVAKSARRLREAVSKHSCDCLIIIYFDESHTLFKRPLQDKAYRYSALCLALDYPSESVIFSLFLSTNLDLPRYMSLKDDALSARMSRTDVARAPFTEFPFDCHPEFPISQGQYTLQMAGELSFLGRFGRPLFWTRYNLDVDPQAQQTVIALAEQKLDPNLATPWIANTCSVLSVLDIRLLLNFEPNSRGKEVEENMVASRMRIAHSVPGHGYYMYSSYPSEPILAEAAARIWTKYRQTVWGELVIPKMLQQHFSSRLISKGERGELVARLILTLAYDAAVRRHQGALHTFAVPLESFLRELFGDAHYEHIAKSKPDFGSDTFHDAFKNAQVRFTHFVRGGDDSTVSTEAAYVAILRSMAFQCSHVQKTVDIVIPVTLEDKALREGIMTGILISVKDHVKSSRTSVDIDASKLSFFPEDQKRFGDMHLRPYISLVMDLGIVPTKKHHAPRSGDVDMPPLKKSKVGPELLGVEKLGSASPPRSSPKPANPRYRIYAYGYSPSTYKVVTSEDIFASLLSPLTLLAEHPRQTDTFLGAVKQQKPFWSRGTEFYGWLKDVKMLHDTSFTEQEGVEVGKI